MDAREWLTTVKHAAQTVQYEQRWADIQRSSAAMTYGSSFAPRVHTGASDPMAAIDALIDGQDDHSRRLAEALAYVSDAMLVLNGMSAVGELEREAADVLALMYVHLVPTSEIAAGFSISKWTVYRRRDYGIDWLDANGFAHAKASTGIAT